LDRVAARRSSDYVHFSAGNEAHAEEALTNRSSGMMTLDSGSFAGLQVVEHAALAAAFLSFASVTAHVFSVQGD